MLKGDPSFTTLPFPEKVHISPPDLYYPFGPHNANTVVSVGRGPGGTEVVTGNRPGLAPREGEKADPGAL